MTPKTDSVAVLREYAERDVLALRKHYVKHVAAMTAEGLHDKSDIAAELAWRDAEIERLNAALSAQGEDSGRKLLGTMLELGCSATAQMHVCTLLGYPENVHPRDVREAVAYFTLHPAPSGSDAVTEELVASLAMEAASFIDNEYQHGRARPNAHRIREHLRAAPAATAAISAQEEGPSNLRIVAKRNLRALIINGSDDKELMLKCLDELS